MEAAHDVIHFPVIVFDTEDDSINLPSEGHKDFKVWRMCFSFSILISNSWYPYDFMGHAEVMS